MSAPVVVFDGVWKKFVKGERYDTLRDLIPNMARHFLRPTATELGDREFWVLRDVSFEVRPGEAFGIIGPNGAGKSTALKLLTRILKPNKGRSAVLGRIGALIEVTAGFHHDLTGRENVYFQGAIMGMRRAEIARRFDEIVEFAGLESFIDTPTKRYSSGMTARLGFSIAAHLNPHALIIDEVLAVGDIAFQQRCYERMSHFKRQGVAIVFVSHNFAAIREVCDRVGLLDQGQMTLFDRVSSGIAAYTAGVLFPGTGSTAGGRVSVLDVGGNQVASVQSGEQIQVVAALRPDSDVSALSSRIMIRHVESGELVYETGAQSVGAELISAEAGSAVEARWVLRANLARGHYIVEVNIFDSARRWPVASASAAPFAVEEDETEKAMVWLDASCAIRLLREEITEHMAPVAERILS